VGLPEKFGEYLLEEKLAAGGMAEVFAARERRTDERVCIKRILPVHNDDEQFGRMFRDEAAIMKRLSHPNIVEVYGFGDVHGQLYLAMELVEGVSLGRLIAQHIRAKWPLDIAAVAQIGVYIARALHHAHQLKDSRGKLLGVVHRDVSPQNVLVGHDGSVKLVDFGVAKAEGRLATTRTGMTKGKVPYMSPEQTLGHDLDHRSDQFSAGILLWEMLVGRRLFRAKTDFQVMKLITNTQVPPPSSMRSEVPHGFDRAVLRALEKEPKKRYADMATLERALTHVLADVSETPGATDLSPLVRRAVEGFDESTERVDAALVRAAKRMSVEGLEDDKTLPVDAIQDTEPMLEAYREDDDEE
jgi:serine/threonine-protein kinase